MLWILATRVYMELSLSLGGSWNKSPLAEMSLVALLFAAWPVSLGLLAGGVHLLSGRRLGFRSVLASLAVADLGLGPILGPMVDAQGYLMAYPVHAARWWWLAGSCVVVATLAARIPLPDFLFPLRGRWLHWFWIGIAVVGLGQLTPPGAVMETMFPYVTKAPVFGHPGLGWLVIGLGAAVCLWPLVVLAQVLAARAGATGPKRQADGLAPLAAN